MYGWQRPNGGVMMVWGWILLMIGAAMLLTGILQPTFSDSGFQASNPYLRDRLPTVNEWKWPLIWMGVGLSNLSMLLLLVGHIVRAIWFLPSREDLELGTAKVEPNQPEDSMPRADPA